MNNLKQLKAQRLEYRTVAWKSSNKVSTKIWDLENSYLLNIMRSISKSLTLYKDFPIEEFSMYEGVKYELWQRYLMTEYKYREALVEEQYRNYLDNEIYVQSVKDSAYYDNSDL